MAQRPDIFTLNESHHLAKGLVFAGLGAHAGSTRYHDSSVYGNTGTLTNMETATDWSRGLGRQVIEMDGTNEFVTVADSNVLRPLDPFTISAWCYATSSADGKTIFSSAQASSNSGWMLTYFGGVMRMYGRYELGTWFYAYEASATLNEWVHYSGGWNGGTMFLYKNGVAQTASGSITTMNYGTTNTAPFIGRYSTGYFSGRIGDPCIHSRILPTPEIRQLADPSNVMLSGLINPPRRKWWPVVSGAAPTFKAAWATKRRQTIGGGVI